VPAGNEARFVYFRGGNSSSGLICVIVIRDGEPMRYFPIGGAVGYARRAAGRRDLLADTKVEIHLAAPEAAAGTPSSTSGW
jgi:assimilatory nitrate reductase catalytic subunit